MSYLMSDVVLTADYVKSVMEAKPSDFFSEFQSVRIHKGNTMNPNTRFNVETLMALANVTGNDEYTQYDALPAGIKEALKRKLKEQADKKVEDAADSVLYLINATDDSIKRRVDRIRELRREVDQLKVEIGFIERAKEYGMQTQNFVPLAAGLGFVSRVVPGAQIPDSFGAVAAKKTTAKAGVKADS